MGVTEEAGSRCINIRWAINHLKEVKVSGKDNANIKMASGKWDGAGERGREGFISLCILNGNNAGAKMQNMRLKAAMPMLYSEYTSFDTAIEYTRKEGRNTDTTQEEKPIRVTPTCSSRRVKGLTASSTLQTSFMHHHLPHRFAE